MRKKRLSKLKLLIIITLLISLFYLGLYLYSTGNFFIKRSCPEEGGICKSSCSPWERQGLSCSQDNVCCIPFEQETIQLAIDKRDASMCQYISNAAAKKSCQDAVLNMIDYDFAQQSGDSTYCAGIDDESVKNSCFKDLALKLHDSQICSLITITETRDSCYFGLVRTGNDGQLCSRMSLDFNIESCMRHIAELTQDSSICSGLKIYSQYYECFKQVDLRKNAPFNVDCESLSRKNCDSVRGCKTLFINELNQAVEAYGGCARNEQLFCEMTQGSWEDITDSVLETVQRTCNCRPGMVYYRGFGCFECSIFTNDDVREECESRL